MLRNDDLYPWLTASVGSLLCRWCLEVAIFCRCGRIEDSVEVMKSLVQILKECVIWGAVERLHKCYFRIQNIFMLVLL